MKDSLLIQIYESSTGPEHLKKRTETRIENLLLLCPPNFWTFHLPWIVGVSVGISHNKSVQGTMGSNDLFCSIQIFVIQFSILSCSPDPTTNSEFFHMFFNSISFSWWMKKWLKNTRLGLMQNETRKLELFLRSSKNIRYLEKIFIFLKYCDMSWNQNKNTNATSKKNFWPHWIWLNI